MKVVGALAADCCFTQVEFESDCLILIQAVTTDSAATLCNYFGNIIQGIKALKGKFRSCKFSHTGRAGNRVAHALAQDALVESNKNVSLIFVVVVVACTRESGDDEK
jgi:hypothetical protein